MKMTFMDHVRFFVGTSVFGLLICMAIGGAGLERPVKATVRPHAEFVKTPPGSLLTLCYVIYDENNKAVGGNCQ